MNIEFVNGSSISTDLLWDNAEGSILFEPHYSSTASAFRTIADRLRELDLESFQIEYVSQFSDDISEEDQKVPAFSEDEFKDLIT